MSWRFNIQDSAQFLDHRDYLNVKQTGEIDHVNCFVQKIRLSSCLISSVDACFEGTLQWICSKFDNRFLHSRGVHASSSAVSLKQKMDVPKTKTLKFV